MLGIRRNIRLYGWIEPGFGRTDIQSGGDVNEGRVETQRNSDEI